MGIFKGGLLDGRPIDSIVPVDLYISGCPPRAAGDSGPLADAPASETSKGWRNSCVPPQGFRGDPHVDEAKCVRLRASAHVCPADAIEIVANGATRRVGSCTRTCIFCVVSGRLPSEAVSCVPVGRDGFRQRRFPLGGAPGSR